MTALKPYAAWTVVQMGSVNQDGVVATMDGQAVSVINLPATVDAPNMDSVKMEPAFVLKDGMVDTALCLVAKMDALGMANVLWRKANTDVFALKVGPVAIAQLHWR